MTDKRGLSERFSLSRWSRRKLDAAKPAPAAIAPAPTTAAAASAPAAASSATELPPIESLTFDSDFTAFLRPGVDDEVKRAALKKLLRDPRFNVMDGLDTYIDDYTKSEAIAPDVVADMLKRGFDRVAGIGADDTPTAAPTAAGAAASDSSPPVAQQAPVESSTAKRAGIEPAAPGEGADDAPTDAKPTDESR